MTYKHFLKKAMAMGYSRNFLEGYRKKYREKLLGKIPKGRKWTWDYQLAQLLRHKQKEEYLEYLMQHNKAVAESEVLNDRT